MPTRAVVEALEAVHLLLAFPLFVVIVAVDTRWLTRALRSAAQLGRRRRPRRRPDGEAYLEKIFQIPFLVQPLPASAGPTAARLLAPSVRDQASPGSGDRHPSGLRVEARQRQAVDAMLARRGNGVRHQTAHSP